MVRYKKKKGTQDNKKGLAVLSNSIRHGKSDMDIYASVQDEQGGFKMRKAHSVDDLLQHVSEITHIMSQNLIKMRDREGSLDDLLVKGEQLKANVSLIRFSRKLLFIL